MFWNILISSILLIAFFIYFFLHRKFSFFKDRGIPHLTPKWPLGNVSGLGTKYQYCDILLDVYRKCKGKDIICGFFDFFQPVFIVLDPELAKNILVKDFNNFVERGGFYNEEDEPLTGHVFAIGGDKWRFLRTKLTPVFTSGKLKGMYPIVINKGDNLVAAIEREMKGVQAIEAKNITNRFTIDIITSVAFGMEANTLNNENPKLIMLFKEIFGEEGANMLKLFFLFAFPNFCKRIKLRAFSKSVSDFFMGVVGENIKRREASKENRKDFLDMLIQLKNKGSIDGEFSSDVKKLTLNETLAQAFIFFLAGSETSSTTISFALAHLGNDQKIQEKLRKEILEKVKETNGEVTYEALHEMNYLNMVVNESLRMYPPVILNARVASKDYQVPNTKHVIPKGTPVWVHAVGFHYDEKYYKNPLTFDPERFTQEEINKRPKLAFLPFGKGPRNCLGARFGLLNVKLALIYIIKNFKVTADPSLKFPIKFDPKNPFLAPVGGFMLKFEKIEV